MAKRHDYENLTTEQVRQKLRRLCYEKTLTFLESDGLVTADEAKMAVQSLGVLSKEDATAVHRDALEYAVRRSLNRCVERSKPHALGVVSVSGQTVGEKKK